MNLKTAVYQVEVLYRTGEVLWLVESDIAPQTSPPCVVPYLSLFTLKAHVSYTRNYNCKSGETY